MRWLAGVLLFWSLQATAQYGNEWIDYNRSYYKIKVAQDGIYRLDYAALTNAGVPLAAIDAKTFHLYHRGVEQALHVVNSGSSQIEPGEYIEFFGQKNDGTLDTDLYVPGAQPHSYYNLYSDTTAYFLTWNNTNGKRMELFQEANVDALPPEVSHTQRILNLYTSDYSLGDTQNTYISQSIFDFGEGWTGERIKEGEFLDFQLTGITGSVQAAGDPELEILLAGRNELIDQSFDVWVGPSAGSLRNIGNFNIEFFENLTVTESLQWSDIAGDGSMIVRVDVGANASTLLSNVSVSFIQVRFPQDFDMASAVSRTYTLAPVAGGKSYIEISNTPATTGVYDITDPNSVRIIGFTGGANEVHAIVDQTTIARTLYVAEQPAVPIIPAIEAVSFQNIQPAGKEYVVISHRSLTTPFGQDPNPVRTYLSYRASAEGGGYDTLSVWIDDLINQYSFGEHSPLAIFNFMRRMVTEGDPRYLFIIGKGLEVNLRYHRLDPSSFSLHDLVPTGGMPPSDVVFTAGLAGTTYEPAVPTGRLSAASSEDIVNYLAKVKEKEALPFDNLWQKEMLHLSGGQNAFEKVEFEALVNRYEDIGAAQYLGGVAETITKNTTSSVEFINVSDEINEGKNIVTFFGHSGEGITDIDIGNVTNPTLGYNNAGRYPTFLVNGCNAGDFFGNYVNWGSDWLHAKDLGAVNFIAHTSFGFVASLNSFTSRFYEVGYSDSLFVERTIGEIHKEATARYMSTASTNPVHRAQAQQMMLNGDPATRLFGTRYPDYTTRDLLISASSSDGNPISNTSPSFNLEVITENYGAGVIDSLEVAVTRTFPDGTRLMYDTLMLTPVLYKDTLVIELGNSFDNAGGLNRFEISLNPSQAIEELNYQNNIAFFNLVIPLNGTVNALPFNYALIGEENVRLHSHAANLNEAPREFIVELDSTIAFNSMYKQQYMESAIDLITWDVTVPSSGEAYYWRSKYKTPAPGEEDEWELSSFGYVPGVVSGWGQLEFDQFRENAYVGLELDTVNKRWDFEENSLSLFVRTFGADHPDFNYENVEVEIDGLSYVFAGRLCRDNTINLIAFDRSTAAPYAALFEEVFDPTTCGRQIQVINNYTEAELLGADDYLVQYIDAVPINDQVVLFTIGQVNYSSWTTEMLNKLNEIGVDASDIQALQDGEPLIIMGRKGSLAGSAQFITATQTPENEQEVVLNSFVNGQFIKATITSTDIGPAMTWNSAFTEVSVPDVPGQEGVNFEIHGKSAMGDYIPLLTDLPPGDIDLSSIDPVSYPYIKLQATVVDSVGLTPMQIREWLVNYETPPEGILLNRSAAVSVDEGQPAQFSFAFRNLSEWDFTDSLWVRYEVFNVDSRNNMVDSLRIAPPGPGQQTEFTLDIETLGFIGTNDLSILVNPGILTEQSLTNNLLFLAGYLEVQPDVTNPLVDVTIDGQHIFDGDIVAPSPLILVEVRDDNEHLVLADTSVVDIFIVDPCQGCTERRISYSGDEISWTASDGKDPFRVEFQPGQLADGMYTLKVQARDASGNEAGEAPFEIRFEVINESTITNVYPYPNPFSTSTRFVFTLTGAELPDQMKIQIMTVSGRVVREITQDELGPLRIGNNLTEFAWDGRDEFGDPLANGPYLYKVFARINGKQIDARESAGDKGFTKGYGKLYILR